jgi:PPOX class probable F420-dependent enzyme
VDAEGARTFLTQHHHAVLATMRADGRPQLSPVLCTVDAEGRVLVSTRETAMKARNLRRDPRASLCVFTDRFFGEWVQVEGTAEVIGLPAAMDLLVDYYRRTSGEHADWDDYRAAMQRERRVAVRFAIERAGPTTAG